MRHHTQLTGQVVSLIYSLFIDEGSLENPSKYLMVLVLFYNSKLKWSVFKWPNNESQSQRRETQARPTNHLIIIL